MDRLRRERRPLRALITRVANEVELQIAADQPDLVELQVHLQQLEDAFINVQEIDQKILDAMLDGGCSDEEQDTEHASIEEYKNKVRRTKVKINNVLTGKRNSMSSRSPANSDFSTAASLTQARKKKTYKLPKIEIRKFNGELLDWLGWWAQFKKIHEDKDLDDSDKFQYLVQSMVPGTRAKDLVDTYPQSAENYKKVVKALEERFGKTKLLKQVYVRELLKMVIYNAKSGEKQGLSRMYDKLESHLRALESLGVTMEQSSDFLFPMVESSLPEEIMVAWQRSSLYGKDGSNEIPPKSQLDFLLQFIKFEVENEEQRKLVKAGLTLTDKKTTKDRKTDKKWKNKYEEDDLPTAAGLFSGQSFNCIFCGKSSHQSHDCIKAQSMSMSAKKDRIKQTRACFNCLRAGHNANKCKTFIKCPVCGKKHHAIMCQELIDKKMNDSRSESKSESSAPCPTQSGLANMYSNGEVLLESVMVNVVGQEDSMMVRLLFDNGSQRSSILTSVAEEVNCPIIGEENIRRSLFGGLVTNLKSHKKFKIRLQNLNSKRSCEVIALGEEVICGVIPRVTSGPWMKELKQHKIWLEDTAMRNPDKSEISVLIGNDYYQHFMTGKRVILKSGLVAVETIFGWTLSGRLPSGNEVSLASAVASMCSLSFSPKDLWSLEAIGIADPGEHKSKVQKDEETKLHFLETVSRRPDGRYTVKLPWVSVVDGAQELPSNRRIAESRLQSTTKKLEQSSMVVAYDRVFKDWEKEGIIELVEKPESESPTHYIPHRAVIKLQSSTTPIRPVFDASCKVGRNPSLNDLLLKGPNLMELIPDLLTRFREKKLGVIADIRKAFLMVEVNESDRDFLRFLWWDESKNIKVYRHCRVVFGVTCSPFLLAAVIEHHINSLDEIRKPIGKMLLKSLYVDNCVTSVENYNEYLYFKKISTEILAEAKMELRQWEFSTGDGSGIGSLVSSECGLDTGSGCTQEDSRRVSVTKVLGLNWNKFEDTLWCEIPEVKEPEKITKRIVLSEVQKIYDPLGFLCPTLLVPKLIIQKLWEKKLSWDDEIPEDLKNNFVNWISNVHKLSSVRIPRHITAGEVSLKEIHTFCDASQYCYAAVVFLRSVLDGEVTVRILQAKARVAPLKKISIPRMELLACVIGARLTESVKNALEFEEVSTTYWSDSSTAIAWIRRNNEWGTFVGNRVKEICKLTRSDSWHHIPGLHNPADLPSRGCNPSQLVKSKWWEGPDWMKLPKEEWPTEEFEVDEEVINYEKKATSIKLVSLCSLPLYANRFSSFESNVHVVGWILRFIKRCQRKSKQFGDLCIEELEEAEKTIFRLIQGEIFDKKADVISGIKVIHGGDGLVRVSSKLLHSQDSENFRLPILLPNNHILVDQLIRNEHIKNKHAGIQFMMSKLREKYWIIQARRTIKKIIGSCVVCRRFTTKKVTVPAAALPQDRVNDSKAFQIIGIDLAGPLYLKDRSKVWIVLFTCAMYRCIHLEVVTSLSSDSFILAFWRFVSRRGRPLSVYTDNGTNFVGSDNLFKQLDWNRITKETRLHRINWKFNPPSAAWWGGFWERLVRSVKDLLKRMLGHSKLNLVQLETCLCEVESIINGRPLTYVTEDQDDLIPLTPAMFIQDVKDSHYPEAEALNAEGLRQKYKDLQKLRQELRGRFRKEYLGLLIQRGQSKKDHSFKLGDIVLVGSDDKKRLDWPLARIIQFLPGKDGKVRTAKVKTEKNELLRPLQRLYPLEVGSEFIQSEMVKVRAKKQKSSPDPKKPEEEVVTKSGRLVRKPDRFNCNY